MTRSSRRTARLLASAAAAVVVGVVALPACSSGGGPELTIYSGRTENLVRPILEDFAEETGIDIAVQYGQSADLALLIDEEGDQSPADVFISQSPGAMGFLDEQGRLRPLPDAVLERVDERFRPADGDWVGFSGRVRVLVYDTEAVSADELPDSVFDLTAPEWRGRVGLAPANGSFQDFVTGMRVLVGDDRTAEWLRGMRENDAQEYANNNAILEAVQRGEIDVGLVNHYYNERAKAEDPGTASENHFLAGDDPGALILNTAVGVLDTADRPEEAEQLVEFLLSERAQRFFADETFEYPLASDVEPVEGLPPLDSIPSPVVDLSQLAGGLERTRELIRESGLQG